MYIKRSILTLITLLLAVMARAQFDTHFTHYWALQGYYNPAVAGLSGRLNMYGTYAMQMAGYTNAPTTMLIGADMALPTEKKNQAISANLYNESIGLFTNQRLFAGDAVVYFRDQVKNPGMSDSDPMQTLKLSFIQEKDNVPLTIGVATDGASIETWFKVDNFRLYRVVE